MPAALKGVIYPTMMKVDFPASSAPTIPKNIMLPTSLLNKATDLATMYILRTKFCLDSTVAACIVSDLSTIFVSLDLRIFSIILSKWLPLRSTELQVQVYQ